MASADILAFVLDGLADYLALERELGVRAIEVDRALLAPGAPTVTEGAAKLSVARGAADAAAATGAGATADRTHGTQTTHRTEKPAPKAVSEPPPTAARPSRATAGPFDFIFIADKPLSPRAVEMMAKIIPAMGQTPETAPVVVSPPIPNARFFVFLGRAALAKYMPGLRGEENRWLKSPKGKDVLLVKSPEEIVRFTTVTPALKKMKQEMWLALKTVRQRAQLGM